MRHWLSIYLKGVFMGAADSIPGVSGGTIALITGIYERLLDAIAAIDADLVSSLFGVGTAEGRAEFYAQLREMDVGFLLVLGAGIATALVTMSRAVHLALNEYPVFMFAFFFGLIGASAIVLYKHVSVNTPGRIAAAVIGFVLAFLLSGEVTGSLPHSPLVLFVTGAIAISAMILPGVSGAFLLFLFGQYEYLTGTLSAFVDALIALPTGGPIGPVINFGTTVVTFAAGALVGLLTISNVVSWALDNYRAATLTFLVSLMVGALRLPVEKILAGTSGTTSATTWAVVVLVALVGGAAVLLMDYYTDDLEYESESPPPGAPGRAD